MGRFPFRIFPQYASDAQVPRSLRGTPLTATTSALIHIMFRGGLCLQTLWILLHRRDPVHPSHFGSILRLWRSEGKLPSGFQPLRLRNCGACEETNKQWWAFEDL